MMMKARLLALSMVLILSGLAFAGAESDYKAIFGEEEKAVLDQGTKASPPFAAKLLAATKSVGEQKDLLILLCEKAYEFGVKDPAGYETAAEAMKLLAEAAPDKKEFAQDKLLDLLRLRYAKSKGDERNRLGQGLVEMLLARGDEQVVSGRHSEGVVVYREAATVAEACKSERAQEIKGKIQAINSRQESEKKLTALKARLEKNPKDAVVRTELILAYLGELDNPSEAVKLLADDLDEKLRTYVPLSAKKIEELEEGPCLELAQWYAEIAGKVSSAGKGVLVDKSKACCERYLEAHTNQDASRLKGTLLLEKLVRADETAGLVLQKSITLIIGNDLTMKVMLIPAGKFMMGSPEGERNRESSEGPQHEVTISKPFYMGMHEVTQEQYEAVAGKNPSSFRGARNPVEGVSWDDAVEFCRKLSAKTGKTVRLPTEAQWEYACRAGTKTPFGTGEATSTKLANYNGQSGYKADRTGVYRQRTMPTGSFAPNAWGLCDMQGNVWEWCSDWYAVPYDNTDPRDPKGPDSGSDRVMRGGSWDGHNRFCRSAFRSWSSPDRRSNSIGFRIVLNVK